MSVQVKDSNGVWNDVNGYETSTVLTATLPASSTTISFTNSIISSNKMIDVYTNVPGLNYTDISVSGTTLTLTFEAQSMDISVKLLIH